MTTVAVVSKGKAVGAEEQVEQVGRVLAELEGPASSHVRVLERDEDLRDVLRSGVSRVVVLGGDGSVNRAVAALHRLGLTGVATGPDLGLVPLGTGNDLARATGIPLDPADAARLVLTGRHQPMDLVTDDAGGVVVNAVHVGVGAEAAQSASRLKPLLGLLAYPLGAVFAGLRSSGWRLRVVVDGQVLADDHRRALMVGIGNGPSIGGGTHLLPGARPDDGLLDVVVSRATGPLARTRFAAALREGTHLDDPEVRSARGRSVTVAGEPFGVNADGELGDEVTRRTWTVQPGAWSLLRP